MTAPVPVTRGVGLVRAANPSPMTLDGTNTWLLAEPGSAHVVVVDPGPADPAHLGAVARAATGSGASVALVLLTHGHADHAEGAAGFAARVGAPVRAADAALCVDADPLVGGERLHVAGLTLEIVPAPGHTGDSICVVVAEEGALLTGDTVLGRGSSVVAWPDGRLGDYLHTLAKLRALADTRELRVVLPGHGPVRDDPAELLTGYLDHRGRRLDQVRAAIAGGAADVDAVLAKVYGDIDPGLREPALWSLRAQLEYLAENGERVPEA